MRDWLPAALVMLALVATAAAWAPAPPPAVSAKVSPRFAATRGDFRVVVAVERDPRSRALRTEIDGDNYSSASHEQMDGADAPRIREVWFKSVPPGRYYVRAIVARSDGSREATPPEAVCVSGMDVDCGGE